MQEAVYFRVRVKRLQTSSVAISSTLSLLLCPISSMAQNTSGCTVNDAEHISRMSQRGSCVSSSVSERVFLLLEHLKGRILLFLTCLSYWDSVQKHVGNTEYPETAQDAEYPHNEKKKIMFFFHLYFIYLQQQKKHFTQHQNLFKATH